MVWAVFVYFGPNFISIIWEESVSEQCLMPNREYIKFILAQNDVIYARFLTKIVFLFLKSQQQIKPKKDKNENLTPLYVTSLFIRDYYLECIKKLWYNYCWATLIHLIRLIQCVSKKIKPSSNPDPPDPPDPICLKK